MSARVTAAQVSVLLIETELTTTQIDIFIPTATNVVDNNLADTTLSDATLAIIELWLAAHFCRISEKAVGNETAGEIQEGFQYRLGLRLEVTMYGQQAVALDTTGTLRRLNDKGLAVTPELIFVGGDTPLVTADE